MKKEELKTFLDENKITVDDSQFEAMAKQFETVVPYDRLKAKVDEYNTLKARYDEATANITKLTVDKDILSTERDTLSTKVNELSTYREKYEAFEKAENEKLVSSYTEKLKMFDVTDKDSRFEKINKVKGKLIVPEEGKELTLEQINKNLEVISIAEDTGLFESAKVDDIKTPAPSKVEVSQPTSPIQRFAQKEASV